MRRLLILLAVIVAANVVALLVIFGGDEAAGPGKVVRDAPGYPLRGSLARDRTVVDEAVSAWRDEIANGDEDNVYIVERRPRPEDAVTALWVGDPGTGTPIAVLQHDDLLVELIQREDGWEIVDERFRGWPQGPHSVGSAIVVPAGAEWTYLNASDEDGFKPPGDGLFYSELHEKQAGFLVPEQGADEAFVPIDVVGVGAGGTRRVPKDDWASVAEALDDEGERRALWLASSALTSQQGSTDYKEDPPRLTVTWTGELPGGAPAVLAVLRDADGLGAAVGYGEDGEVELGTGPDSDDLTFAGGAFGDLDDKPQLFLAAGGAVETIQAQVGGKTLRGKAPLTVLEAGEDPDADATVTGRTRAGDVVKALEPGN